MEFIHQVENLLVTRLPAETEKAALTSEMRSSTMTRESELPMALESKLFDDIQDTP